MSGYFTLFPPRKPARLPRAREAYGRERCGQVESNVDRLYQVNPVNPVYKNIMEYEELTHKIIGYAYKVFNELGFGFLESVYKKAMIIELAKNNLKVEAEKPLKVYYDNQVVGDFYIDLFVEDLLVARPPRPSALLCMARGRT